MLCGHQYQMGGRTTNVLSTKRPVSIQYKLAGCKTPVFITCVQYIVGTYVIDVLVSCLSTE